MNPHQNHQAPISENIQKRSNSEDRNDFKKKKIENILSFSKQDNFEFEFESRLHEIKKIKAKDRSEELKREYNTLMRKRNRKSNLENVKRENERQKARKVEARKDEPFKANEKAIKAKKREDEQVRAKENEKSHSICRHSRTAETERPSSHTHTDNIGISASES